MSKIYQVALEKGVKRGSEFSAAATSEELARSHWHFIQCNGVLSLYEAAKCIQLSSETLNFPCNLRLSSGPPATFTKEHLQTAVLTVLLLLLLLLANASVSAQALLAFDGQTFFDGKLMQADLFEKEGNCVCLH